MNSVRQIAVGLCFTTLAAFPAFADQLTESDFTWLKANQGMTKSDIAVIYGSHTEDKARLHALIIDLKTTGAAKQSRVSAHILFVECRLAHDPCGHSPARW